MDTVELLRELSEQFGVSGFEGEGDQEIEKGHDDTLQGSR